MPNRLGWTLSGLQGSDLPPLPGFRVGFWLSPFPSLVPLAFRLRFCLAAKKSGVLVQSPPGVRGGGGSQGSWHWRVGMIGGGPEARRNAEGQS